MKPIFVITITLALCLLSGQAGQCQHSGNEMPLKLVLTLKETSLLYGQDTFCTVLLSNNGINPIHLKLPKMNARRPVLRVLNGRTGDEKVYRREPSAHVMPEEPMQLAPGQSIKESFSLRDIIRDLAVGEYTISVIWEYNEGADRAESNAVSVKVTPTMPADLSLVDAVGGRSGYKYGVWTNRDNNKPGIFYSSFLLSPGGGIEDIVQVSSEMNQTKPFLSAPAPGAPMRSHWVAWVDGSNLHYTHVDRESGMLPLRKKDLPTGQWEIIAPLYSSVQRVEKKRPAGMILLIGTGQSKNNFKLLWLQLYDGRETSENDAFLTGPKPLWMMSHFSGQGEPYLVFLQSLGEKISLFSAPWSTVKHSNPSPVHLFSGSYSLVGASARVDQNGVLHGVLLTQDKANYAKIGIINWSLSTEEGGFKRKSAYVSWPGARKISKTDIAVNDAGNRTAVTITDDKGNLYSYDGAGSFGIVKQEVTRYLLVHKIGFSRNDPVMITGSAQKGFQVLNLDGSPLEVPPSPKGVEESKGKF